MSKLKQINFVSRWTRVSGLLYLILIPNLTESKQGKVKFSNEIFETIRRITLNESVFIFDNTMDTEILKSFVKNCTIKYQQKMFWKFSSKSFKTKYQKFYNSKGASALHMILLLQFPESVNKFFSLIHQNNYKKENDVFYWLITNSGKSFCSIRNQVKLGPDDILNVISSSQESLDFNFIYSKRKSTNCINLKKGYSVENIYPIVSVPKLRADIKYTKIKVVTIHEPTFVTIEKSNPIQMSGIYPDILEILQEDLDTTFDVHIVGDGNYGLKLKNGSWNGMVQELIEGKADIAIGPLSLTEDRAKVIDFSPPVLYSGFSLIYSRPETFFSVSSYLSPFSQKIWILISITFLVFCLTTHIISSFDLNDSNSVSKAELHYKRNIFTFLSIASTQGLYYDTSCMSARAVLFVISIWSIVINVAYTANIMSVLTMTKPKIPFKSLYEFSEQNDYLPLLLENSGDVEFLKNSNATWHQKIYQTALRNKEFSFVKTPTEGRRLIEEKKAAYFGDYLNILMNIQKPGIDYVKEVEGKSGLYIAFRKNFKYKSLITQRLLKIHESGILSRIVSKNIKSGKNNHHYTDEWFQFQISNVYAPFLIYLFGMSISFLIFMVEYLIKKPSKKLLPHTNKSMYIK